MINNVITFKVSDAQAKAIAYLREEKGINISSICRDALANLFLEVVCEEEAQGEFYYYDDET